METYGSLTELQAENAHLRARNAMLVAALTDITTANVRTYMTPIPPEDQLRDIALAAIADHRAALKEPS